jgi:hypothetical protein
MILVDTCSINGITRRVRSWDGSRLNTKAHGPGTLVDNEELLDFSGGLTRQCTLNQGFIYGFCWLTDTSGYKCAQVYNTQGMLHGTEVQFRTNGAIYLRVYNNGKQFEGGVFGIKGMMSIQ